ncbi:MAG: hypothetical protein QM770_02955 [Tepidisphaeraceae bacterium]
MALSPLEFLLHRLARRERANRALRAALVGVMAGSGVALIGLASTAVAIPVALGVGAVIGAMRRVDRQQLAGRVDQLHDLRELLSTARTLDAAAADPFERHVLQHATERARSIDLRAVAPIVVPPRVATLAGLMLVAAVSVGLFRSGESARTGKGSDERLSARAAEGSRSSQVSPSSAGGVDQQVGHDPVSPDASMLPAESNVATNAQADRAPNDHGPGDGSRGGQAASVSNVRDATNVVSQTSFGSVPTGPTVADGGRSSASVGDGLALPHSAADRERDRLTARPWTQADWPRAQEVARAALRDRSMPPGTRAMVRRYFDLAE